MELATGAPEAVVAFVGPMTTRIGAVIMAIIAICLIIPFFVLVGKPTTPLATNIGLGIAMSFFTGLAVYMFYYSSVQLSKATAEHGADLVGMLAPEAGAANAAAGLLAGFLGSKSSEKKEA